jgi:hypothetical protein
MPTIFSFSFSLCHNYLGTVENGMPIGLSFARNVVKGARVPTLAPVSFFFPTNLFFSKIPETTDPKLTLKIMGF